jgi:hypothetical protein
MVRGDERRTENDVGATLRIEMRLHEKQQSGQIDPGV